VIWFSMKCHLRNLCCTNCTEYKIMGLSLIRQYDKLFLCFVIMLQYQNPDKERRNGKCPLTPEEVGLMLRALGYGKDSYLYVASGQVYNGEASLAPLKALFPNFFTKDTLVTRQELQPFAKFSSQMAAIDYVVCSESDVFVANNNGNMARILAGERYALFYPQFLARTLVHSTQVLLISMD